MRRLSGLPDKTGLRVVGVDFQRGEQESLATRFVTAVSFRQGCVTAARPPCYVH
jgi:hypothetical protein